MFEKRRFNITFLQMFRDLGVTTESGRRSTRRIYRPRPTIYTIILTYLLTNQSHLFISYFIFHELYINHNRIY